MNPPAPLKSIDKHGHVLYVGSLSKTLSPGLRIDGLLDLNQLLKDCQI